MRSRGAYGVVHSHFGCAVYEPRGEPLFEAAAAVVAVEQATAPST